MWHNRYSQAGGLASQRFHVERCWGYGAAHAWERRGAKGGKISVALLIVLAFALSIMFGRLFGNKTKRMVAKLEQIMMTMEAAAKAGNLEVLHYAARQQLKVLHWLHVEGEWPEERV